MRFGPRNFLVMAMALASAHGPVLAQDTAKNMPVTLEQAVHSALQQNPAFRSSQDDAAAARARLKQVQSAWYPRVDFHQDFIRGNNPIDVFGWKLTQRQFTASDFALNNLNTPTPLDNFQTRFDGQWRLFDSGQTLFHQRSAKKLVTVADFQTEQARQDLILEVVRAYYGIGVLQENENAAENALKTAEANAQRMETMHTAGTVVDSDLLSAKVFAAQMKDRQIRAQNDLAMAQMQLARLMGLPVEQQLELAGSLSEPNTATKTLQEWTQTALAERPALRAAQLQEAATDDERKAAKAEFGPTVALFGSTERDAMTLAGPSGTNWTAGARVDFNLFAGGATKARLAEAAANANKAKHNLEWFRSGVTLEVRQAFLDTQAAAQRATAARDAADQAKESLRIVQNRYEAGLTTITELLRAQTAQLDARTLYLNALQDWQVSQAQLARAAGVLTPESQLIAEAGKS
ncbi:MAG TPA: TolC family protein [Candidatus Sulfotelmatobacter sp.]|nr:TolC family protein [Candidatus Sulfotelmatobacter sp.]